jgi:hypothetical protein
MSTKDEQDRLYLDNLRKARQEVSDALKAREEATERLERANAASLAWGTIVEQAGLSAIDEPKHAAAPTVVQLESNIHGKASVTAQLDPSNKSEFARRMIENSGDNGITPAEIRAAARKAGMGTLSAGYPYTVIFRLKEQGRVELNERGRYVLTKGPR